MHYLLFESYSEISFFLSLLFLSIEDNLKYIYETHEDIFDSTSASDA